MRLFKCDNCRHLFAKKETPSKCPKCGSLELVKVEEPARTPDHWKMPESKDEPDAPTRPFKPVKKVVGS